MRDGGREGLAAAVDKPSSARVYDYLLGGRHNYAIDRRFAEQQVAMVPDIREAMRSNRAFVGRAVRFALERGVRQFVDIGAGLPSQGQAHEVADRVAPEARARVVYVDNEEIAHAHARILLDDTADPERHKAVFADFFDTDELWRQVLATGVIDGTEPVCLLMTAILHFMPPEREPEKALRHYQDQLCPGSVLVLTHGCVEIDEEKARAVAANYARTTNPAHLRSRAEFTEFFTGWDLVEPGVTWTVEWRPDGAEPEWWGGQPARSRYLAGVAVKP
ncbi:S-adenosyl methyltransferase [Amycolatopsis arida]|uniref:S-adenosyl methyltransferase n=1 Tax=Amycolatopsis arida TaxID=587909 RepID=A0A1I5MFI1_9PSEU|nr:SAM-dependent methyltransferase [Amycolatopsis arida]TDX94076.1 S-adenosyl methyltransferase [Amycolatopsis arida]SFP08290.1 S-adenosyl methyltransferase [Amycolatopsis arida]